MNVLAVIGGGEIDKNVEEMQKGRNKVYVMKPDSSFLQIVASCQRVSQTGIIAIGAAALIPGQNEIPTTKSRLESNSGWLWNTIIARN